MSNQSSLSSDSTKRMLAGSLKKFMARKPLEKITIHEIVDDCGVNRQTFYYHFHDIYDLVEWMYRQEAISLLQEHDSYQIWEDGVLRLLNYIQENKTVCLSAWNSLGHVHLKQFFYTDMHEIVYRVVEDFASGMNVDVEYKEFLTHFYTMAFAGLVESWLLNELHQPNSELVKLISLTINAGIQGALEKYAQVRVSSHN